MNIPLPLPHANDIFIFKLHPLIHLSIYPFLSSSHRQSGAAGGVLVIAQKLRDSSAVDVQEVATTGGAFRAELLHEEHNVRLWQLSLL